MSNFTIQPYEEKHHNWAISLLNEQWGDTKIATRGKLHQADKLCGFTAEIDGGFIGLITYSIEGNQCEIITLNSLAEKQGIGISLINSVKKTAIDAGCDRLWLVTTNDNAYAFRFFQKRGFTVTAYHVDSVEGLRKLKPSIPKIGIDGIIIRDEIELEMNI